MLALMVVNSFFTLEDVNQFVNINIVDRSEQFRCWLSNVDDDDHVFILTLGKL